jgi:hypothetical protein
MQIHRYAGELCSWDWLLLHKASAEGKWKNSHAGSSFCFGEVAALFRSNHAQAFFSPFLTVIKNLPKYLVGMPKSLH